VFSAEIRFFSGPDFTQAGNEPFQVLRFSESNLLNIALAKITLHTNFAQEGKLFITQPDWLQN